MVEIEVIYEDESVVAINKPSGVLTHHPSLNNRNSDLAVTDWALSNYPEMRSVGDDPILRPGIVHRLDRDTSGVMLLARTQEDFYYFKALFKDRKIVKTYRALIGGVLVPRKGSVDEPIGIKDGTIKRTIHSKKMSKAAHTDYVVRSYKKNDKNESFSYVDVFPKTGRTHQIRVHMASLNHPIVGDKIYGKKYCYPWVRQLMLHAFSLEFSLAHDGHGERIHVEAPLVDSFSDTLGNLVDFEP